MLILLTFAVSDGMSHALSPWPGKREEELVGVKSKKAFEKHGRCLQVPHLCSLCLFFSLPLLQPFFSFLFWCRARPNKRQRFAWCVRPLPSCSSLEVCVRPRLHVAVCIWVCVQVLMCAGWLPASLSCKRVEGKKTKPIDISHSNQGNMLKYVTGEVRHLACIFNSVWGLGVVALLS